MNEAFATSSPPTEDCVMCGEHQAVLERRVQRFAYGEEDPVYLTVELPVWSCAGCGESYFAPGAEDIRHDAVCDHLGRLRPQAIRALRHQHHLSQEELAGLTGIGVASIKRWEKGALIQNEAMDRYLRLLAAPHNFAALQSPRPRPAPVFRTGLPDAAMIAAADRFSLRRCEAVPG